jgi:hypothetical protein
VRVRFRFYENREYRVNPEKKKPDGQRPARRAKDPMTPFEIGNDPAFIS